MEAAQSGGEIRKLSVWNKRLERRGKLIYIICGVPCIEVCMESDHKKSFFYKGRYFVKVSDYEAED